MFPSRAKVMQRKRATVKTVIYCKDDQSRMLATAAKQGSSSKKELKLFGSG